MQRRFTRQELYNLVWNQPRSTLSKQLGVSDVWIAKQCRSALIPMPPPGYWARAKHGKHLRRPALPIRLPGQASEIEIGSSLKYPYGRRASHDPSEPISPPTFAENVDEQVRFAMSLIGKVISRRDLSQPHKGLSRILATEAKRRAKYAEDDWSYYKPRFDDPTHQRQLRFFNTICWNLERVHVRAEAIDDEKWIQGVGTTHRLRLLLNFGDASLNLRFLEPSSSPRVTGVKPPTATTLCIATGDRDLPSQSWSDLPENRIEQQLPAILEALLHAAEQSLRQDAQRHYEWRVQRHQEHLRELEAQRVEAERRRLLEIEARKKRTREGILALAHDAQVAREIRLMVSSLEQHPDLFLGHPDEFETWRTEALNLANALDPMKRNLAELLTGFSRSPI
jgi:hypothetical protein